MKKLLLLIMVLLLASCKAEEPMPPSEFDANISITADGTVYEALYEKREGRDRLVFSAPENFLGLELLLADGICTVTFKDVTFESETLGATFDFLPVDGECEKTVGNREYKIYDMRDVK
ncbi:MAG: hypothetical protein IJN48_02910 [Clostridia bacterium]|nr:hypothetical protein [Clostridia bacterium]